MNMPLISREISLPIGSIEAYIHWANQIPMLTAEEEQALAKQYRETEDLEAARKLVFAHLRFVIRVARGYLGYGLNQADLIQEGNIGLMKAVKRFDPDQKVRLVTFAVHWIKAEIHEFILKNWKIVKVATTKAQRKLFFNLRKMKKRMGWSSHEEVQAIALELGVKPEEVLEMENRLNALDISFDLSDEEDENEGYFAPSQYLEDKRYNPEVYYQEHDDQQQFHQKVMHVFAGLDERSRDILSQRFLADEKATLHDLAAKYQISAERIRQLEQNALKKLRQALESQYVA